MKCGFRHGCFRTQLDQTNLWPHKPTYISALRTVFKRCPQQINGRAASTPIQWRRSLWTQSGSGAADFGVINIFRSERNEAIAHFALQCGKAHFIVGGAIFLASKLKEFGPHMTWADRNLDYRTAVCKTEIIRPFGLSSMPSQPANGRPRTTVGQPSGNKFEGITSTRTRKRRIDTDFTPFDGTSFIQ